MKMVPIGCHKTSLTSCQSTPCNIQEQQRPDYDLIRINSLRVDNDTGFVTDRAVGCVRGERTAVGFCCCMVLTFVDLVQYIPPATECKERNITFNTY
jgi:hypothetical protein